MGCGDGGKDVAYWPDEVGEIYEWELRLGFNSSNDECRESGGRGVVDCIAQERALAHAGLTADDEHPAVSRFGEVEHGVKARALRLPAQEHVSILLRVQGRGISRMRTKGDQAYGPRTTALFREET